MAFDDFINIIPGIGPAFNTLIFASAAWLLVLIIVVVILVVTSRKKKGVDVSALATLASSDSLPSEAAPNADPKEVMAILQIERVAASTALSAVKDARRSKRISSGIRDSLINRYKARIAKIDNDLKMRSGAQDYKSLADSLEQSQDKLRSEVMPSSPTPPPPPQSSTPGIPPTAPPVPGVPKPPTAGQIPSIPTAGPTSTSKPPSTPASPIPTPPKIPTVGPSSAKPTTVVPPSVAPPTVSTPPMPPKIPTTPSVTPPTTSQAAPPPVPTSAPTTSAPATTTGDSDTQSISGLRMEMLRELARLKKFMSEETQ